MITPERAAFILRIISQAWGPTDNAGYCFFPWVEGPDRKFKSQAFEWPEQQDDIVDHIVKHQDDDLYWCPMIFDEPQRRTEYAHEEYALWADLDSSDPRKIKPKWRPSVAWETSPGRYQALWLLEDHDEEDLYGASARGADNQRMTMMVNADPSGWDTTQLLRLPGLTNHKPQYEDEDGEFPEGRLMWGDGPRYRGEDFNSLPELPGEDDELPLDEALLDAIDGLDRSEVMDRIKYSLSKANLAKLIQGPELTDDRSKGVVALMNSLAEIGCSMAEMVVVIQGSKWNKFKGRSDEVDRLIKEATEIFKKHSVDIKDKYDYTGKNVNDYISSAEPPTWLIKDVLVKGNVGFIGGEPKARKSWVALDLALSISGSKNAHNLNFLDQFRVMNPGPVLYFVLEDRAYLMADRIKKVWRSKIRHNGGQFIVGDTPGTVVSQPSTTDWVDAPLDLVGGGEEEVNLSDPRSMASLQRRIRERYTYPDGHRERYTLVVIDTFMRAMGGSDINNMGEMMNKILQPLTNVSKQEKTTILIVHHFNKGKPEGETRGGTRLLGSQALHSWAEDSLYLTAGEHGFGLEVESKSAPAGRWDFNTDPTQRTWSPRLADDDTGPIKNLDFTAVEQPKPPNKTLTALTSLGPGAHTTRQIVEASGEQWSPGYTHRSLTGLVDRGKVVKDGTRWRLA